MQNKKKILFLTPSIGFGGAEKNLIYISNIFSKSFDIDFLILQKRKSNFEKQIFNNKIKIYETNFKRTLYAFFTILNKINENQYNYIITSSIQINFYLVIIKFLTNNKFQLIHRESNYPINGKFNLRYILNFILRLFYIGSDKIIVQNDIIKEKLNKFFFINKHKVFKINNLFDLQYVKKKSQEKIKIKKNIREKVLINVGALNEQKNQIEILKALKILENQKLKYKMLFIGEGPQLVNLKNFVNINKLKKIYFLGNKKNPYKYIKNSDLFILSSKWEGVPNVLIESEILKTKIISSNCKTGPAELKMIGFNIDMYESGNHINLAKILKNNFKIKLLTKNNKHLLEKINKETIKDLFKLIK